MMIIIIVSKPLEIITTFWIKYNSIVAFFFLCSMLSGEHGLGLLHVSAGCFAARRGSGVSTWSHGKIK
jgi:hypothetical protein